MTPATFALLLLIRAHAPEIQNAYRQLNLFAWMRTTPAEQAEWRVVRRRWHGQF